MPKKIRSQIIQVIEESVKRLDKTAEEMTADRLARGWDPHPEKDISIGYNRIIASITRDWLATMIELLEAEEEVRRLSKKRRKVARS